MPCNGVLCTSSLPTWWQMKALDSPQLAGSVKVHVRTHGRRTIRVMVSFFSSRARPTFSVALPTGPRGRSFADASLLIDGEGALSQGQFSRLCMTNAAECLAGRSSGAQTVVCMSVLVSETGRSRPGRRHDEEKKGNILAVHDLLQGPGGGP